MDEQFDYSYDSAFGMTRRSNLNDRTYSIGNRDDVTNEKLPNNTVVMTYAYDLQGNRTGRTDTQTSAVVTYVYDAKNQWIEASTPTTAVGAFKVQFTYDGKDRLRKRKDFTAVGSVWNAGNETLYI